MARKHHRRERDEPRHHRDTSRSDRRDTWGANESTEAIFERPPGTLSEVTDLLEENYRTLARDSLPASPADFQPTGTTGYRIGAQQAPARHLVRVQPAKLYGQPAPISVGDQADRPGRRQSVCVKRHQRIEVMHALGKTGRGSRLHKKPTKPPSTVRC